MNFLSCCNFSPEPQAIFHFSPHTNPLVVYVDLENTICDPLCDAITLVPIDTNPPERFVDIQCYITLNIEKDPQCENFCKGSLNSQQVPRGIYYFCYLKLGNEDYMEIGRSKAFHYGRTTRNTIFVRGNSPFKLPSQFGSFMQAKGKNERICPCSDISRSTCEESTNMGSVFAFQPQQQKSILSASFCENLQDEDIEIDEPFSIPEIKSIVKRIAFGAGNKKMLVEKDLRENRPVKIRFVKCSILSPSKRLFTVKESATPAEESQPSVRLCTRNETKLTENIPPSIATESVEDQN